MSDNKKQLSLEERLDRFEAALEAERKARVAERKADRKADRKARAAERKARAAERKARVAEREARVAEREDDRKAERKARATEREDDRKEWAVKMGELSYKLGKLAEFAIESGILDTLDGYADLDVTHILPNVEVQAHDKGKDELGEIDIIATGKRDIVVIETKVTLSYDDVSKFVAKYLRNFPRWQASSPHILLPKCEGKRIFGCLAYAQASSNAEDAAIKAGLITVHVFGSSSKIAYPDTKLVDFQPNP